MSYKFTIPDGPQYDHKPNYLRTAVLERPADIPGFWRCRDVNTGEVLTVNQSKVPEWVLEEFSGAQGGA